MKENARSIIITCIGEHDKEHIKELARDGYIVKQKEAHIVYEVPAKKKRSFFKWFLKQ